MGAALTEVRAIDLDLEAYLNAAGEIFRAFRNHDSGCVSYGVRAHARLWFVKHSDEPRGIASLRRAAHLYTTVRHPALPRLHNAFETPAGLALVLDWLPGEVLYGDTVARGRAAREDPAGPHSRFRALPVRQILVALDTIYAVHLALAAHGFVAVDFYDGCILYDFEEARTSLCDLDEYRPGPFTLEADHLPGSRRFMAPEEWQRGARIDQVTNVYTLGRTAIELLGGGTLAAGSWKGTDAMRAIVTRATAVDRSHRFQSVREFVEAWRSAVSAGR
jgi:serine/threonine-protein kinase